LVSAWCDAIADTFMANDVEWENRPPAKITLEKLTALDKLNCELKEKDHKIELTIQGMGDNIEGIKERLNEHIDQQKDDFRSLRSDIGVLGAQNRAMYEQSNDQNKIILGELKTMIESLDNKYANKNAEYIAYSVVIIFALSALYFIFDRIGLPR
jgi:hypothetical protein